MNENLFPWRTKRGTVVDLKAFRRVPKDEALHDLCHRVLHECYFDSEEAFDQALGAAIRTQFTGLKIKREEALASGDPKLIAATANLAVELGDSIIAWCLDQLGEKPAMAMIAGQTA